MASLVGDDHAELNPLEVAESELNRPRNSHSPLVTGSGIY